MRNSKSRAKRILGYFLALLLFFPIAGRSQLGLPSGQTTFRTPGEGKVLRLEEAIQIALDREPSLRAARERIRIQEAVLGRTKSAYYPTISFNNTYRRSLASGTTQTSQEAFDFFSSQTDVDWTLYDFGRREGNVQQARESVNSQRYAEKTSVENVIVAVKRAYFNYLRATAVVRVGAETVRDRELLVRQAQGFYEVGARSKIEVARAESNLFSAKADLIGAENAVKVTWAELENAMGKDMPIRPLEVELTVQRPGLPLNEIQEAAFATRSELKDFGAQRQAQASAIAVARRDHLPNINFGAFYGRRNTSRSGDTFPLQVIWQVGVSLQIPIFNGFRTTYAIEEAYRSLGTIKAQEEQQRQDIALEVERSYLGLIEAEERIKARNAAVRAAKENLDLANGRYQVGVGSIIEITEAQTLYTDAQTKNIRSIYDFKIAEAELLRAMGWGLRVTP